MSLCALVQVPTELLKQAEDAAKLAMEEDDDDE